MAITALAEKLQGMGITPERETQVREVLRKAGADVTDEHVLRYFTDKEFAGRFPALPPEPALNTQPLGSLTGLLKPFAPSYGAVQAPCGSFVT